MVETEQQGALIAANEAQLCLHSRTLRSATEIKRILKGYDPWMDSDEIRYRMARSHREQTKLAAAHQPKQRKEEEVNSASAARV